MPLELSQLTSNSATARVDYGEAGDINVVYRPANVTERTIAQLSTLDTAVDSAQEMLARIDAINGVLGQLLISWDLTNRGEPIPLTADGFALVPLDVRADILRAIFAESRLGGTPGTDTKRRSSATTARVARSSSVKRG